MFDLETQQWKEVKSMNDNLRYHSLGFYYDGSFYITAGTKYGGVLESVSTGIYVWKYTP